MEPLGESLLNLFNEKYPIKCNYYVINTSYGVVCVVGYGEGFIVAYEEEYKEKAI